MNQTRPRTQSPQVCCWAAALCACVIFALPVYLFHFLSPIPSLSLNSILLSFKIKTSSKGYFNPFICFHKSKVFQAAFRSPDREYPRLRNTTPNPKTTTTLPSVLNYSFRVPGRYFSSFLSHYFPSFLFFSIIYVSDFAYRLPPAPCPNVVSSRVDFRTLTDAPTRTFSIPLRRYL